MAAQPGLVAPHGLGQPRDRKGDMATYRSPVEIQFGSVVPGAGLHCDLGAEKMGFKCQITPLVL